MRQHAGTAELHDSQHTFPAAGPRLYALIATVPQALALYQELLRQEDPDPLYHTYSAACYYYMGLTQEAMDAVSKVHLPHSSGEQEHPENRRSAAGLASAKNTHHL